MSEEKRYLKVLLCYASADKPKVRELCNRLKDDNVDVWLDEEKLLLGQDRDLEIRKAIRVADVILVALSKYSVTKEGYIQKEIKRALDIADEKLEGAIFIIPARLDDCEVPKQLQRWHWVNLFSQNSYEILIKALAVRAEQIGVLLPRQEGRRPRKRSVLPSIKKEYSVAFIGAIAIIIAGLLGLPSIERRIYSVSVPTATNTFTTSTPALTLTAFATKEPTFTPTAEFTPTTTPWPLVITERGAKMVLIPGGAFIMGNSVDMAMAECRNYRRDCQREWFTDEEPVHKVRLNTYYMDVYEVTNGLYRECVEAGICSKPVITHSSTRTNYYDNPDFDNYPVIYVTWYMAATYCDWRGLATGANITRLPTEAEWEYAARGKDGRTYPWGEGLDTSRANYDSKDTSSVGSYESGKSPFGVYDLAGNVWELVADFYGVNYYSELDENWYNPEGPPSGIIKVRRGGSWNSDVRFLRTSGRSGNLAYSYKDIGDIGFRCIRSFPY